MPFFGRNLAQSVLSVGNALSTSKESTALGIPNNERNDWFSQTSLEHAWWEYVQGEIFFHGIVCFRSLIVDTIPYFCGTSLLGKTATPAISLSFQVQVLHLSLQIMLQIFFSVY